MSNTCYVTQYELDKLVGLSREEPFLCRYSDDLFDELKRPRAMGLVQNRDGVGLSVMRDRYKDRDQRFDLKEMFFITKRGTEYLRLREETMYD